MNTSQAPHFAKGVEREVPCRAASRPAQYRAVDNRTAVPGAVNALARRSGLLAGNREGGFFSFTFAVKYCPLLSLHEVIGDMTLGDFTQRKHRRLVIFFLEQRRRA